MPQNPTATAIVQRLESISDMLLYDSRLSPNQRRKLLAEQEELGGLLEVPLDGTQS